MFLRQSRLLSTTLAIIYIPPLLLAVSVAFFPIQAYFRRRHVRRWLERLLEIQRSLQEDAAVLRTLCDSRAVQQRDLKQPAVRAQRQAIAGLEQARKIMNLGLLRLHRVNSGATLDDRSHPLPQRSAKALANLRTLVRAQRREIVAQLGIEVKLPPPMPTRSELLRDDAVTIAECIKTLKGIDPRTSHVFRRSLLDAELHTAVLDPIALYGVELQDIAIARPNWLHDISVAPPSSEELTIRLVGLKRAVTALRKLEASFDFQAELLVDAARVSADAGYPMETFAYGSTPLRSFLALFACDAVTARLARSDPQRHTPHGLAPLPTFVVLGSSLGWLVFYGACVFGLPSEGVEILPLLCRTATETAAAAGLGDCVRFENADMLTHDLRGADIVMLASQCWDEELRRQLAGKLLNELAVGAIVLDYSDFLGGVVGRARRLWPHVGGNCFREVNVVTAPVSWDAAHKFYVYVVGAEPVSAR